MSERGRFPAYPVAWHSAKNRRLGRQEEGPGTLPFLPSCLPNFLCVKKLDMHGFICGNLRNLRMGNLPEIESAVPKRYAKPAFADVVNPLDRVENTKDRLAIQRDGVANQKDRGANQRDRVENQKDRVPIQRDRDANQKDRIENQKDRDAIQRDHDAIQSRFFTKTGKNTVFLPLFEVSGRSHGKTDGQDGTPGVLVPDGVRPLALCRRSPQIRSGMPPPCARPTATCVTAKR